MAILIKCIEMPKTCIDCPLHDGEYGQCNINHNIYISFDDRPRKCPLTEINSHYLIDADRVIHTHVYDDEYEEIIDRSITIADFLDEYTEEGCPMSETEREVE